MGIPFIDISFFETNNEKILKKRVADYCKKNLVGKKIRLDNNILIELTWQGLKNDINEYHHPYIEKLISFGIFEEILKQAKFLLKEKDKRNRYNVWFFRFFSRAKIGENIYDIIIIIKKTNKNFVYDHILIET